MQGPQIKCMDLPALYRVVNYSTSDGVLHSVGIDDNHPNHYLRHGNREYVRDEAHSDWLRIWVSWYDVQEQFKPPTSYQQHCDQLNSRQDYWGRVDEVIRAANDDHIYVLVTMLHYYPGWAVPANAPQPGTGMDRRRHFPDIEIGGLWDNFISYVYNRYRFRQPDTPPNNNGFYNSKGPGSTASADNGWMGNPRRAYMSAFEIVNEPNWTHWPQQATNGDMNDVYCCTTKMIQTAENAVNFWNGIAGGYGPALLAPALADTPINREDPTSGVRTATNYYDVVSGVLNNLANWRPRVYVAWSHHNYGDWTERGNNGTGYPRVARVRDLLYERNWRGGGDRNVYVTEGGYRMGSPYSPGEWPAQDTAMNRVLWDFLNIPEAAMLTNFTRHTVNGSTFNTGVRHFDSATTFPASTTFANI